MGELLDLHRKVAIVTGGAMGIGLGIARRLVEAGASVILSDVNLEVATSAAAKLDSTTTGGRVFAVKTDVSRAADAKVAIAEAVRRFGRVDILVNNAGVYPMSPARETPESLWTKTLDINLKGSFLMAQAAANEIVREKHGGVIVNVASIDSFHPTGFLAHYDASKGGVVMLTKALAKEWGGNGIRVVAVAPGGIETPGAAAATGDATSAIDASTFYAKQPIPRAGTADEIGRVVAFLASDAASYITGTTVVVDGGALVS
ncbi:MAG: SDR family NAD(P)-dependent oxidoreductase [Thermoplasmatota archaeon]